MPKTQQTPATDQATGDRSNLECALPTSYHPTTEAEARQLVIAATVDRLVAEIEGVGRCSNLSAPSQS